MLAPVVGPLASPLLDKLTATLHFHGGLPPKPHRPSPTCPSLPVNAPLPLLHSGGCCRLCLVRALAVFPPLCTEWLPLPSPPPLLFLCWWRGWSVYGWLLSADSHGPGRGREQVAGMQGWLGGQIAVFVCLRNDLHLLDPCFYLALLLLRGSFHVPHLCLARSWCGSSTLSSL